MNDFKEGPGDIGSTGFGEGPGANIVGPGGQAPPFAPGGPENPYPASAGMPPPNAKDESAFQPGFLGSGAIGSGLVPGQPGFMGYPTTQPTTNIPGFYPTSVAAIGGAGVPTGAPQGLPGHGTTPGRFQPGGGVSNMPQAGTLPSQRPGQREAGFLARITHVSGDVSRITPVASGGGLGGPGVMPPIALPPTIPGQGPGVGGGPIIPGEPPSVGEPGFPTPPIVIPPDFGGGPTQGKPRGLKTLPMPKDKQPPSGPPKPPGQWVTLDAGRGQPPAYAFIEDSGPGTDDGLEGPQPKGGKPGTLPSRPPGSTSGEKGHYVPVLLPYMVQPTGEDSEPTWAWVPTIDDTYGVKEPETVTPVSK